MIASGGELGAAMADEALDRNEGAGAPVPPQRVGVVVGAQLQGRGARVAADLALPHTRLDQARPGHTQKIQ